MTLQKKPSEKPEEPGSVREKFNIFKELVDLFDTKFKATMMTLVVIGFVYLLWKNDNEKEKMYERIITEVQKQVPKEVGKQIAPIKERADSNTVTIRESRSKLDTVLNSVKSTLKNVNKSLK